MSQHGEQDVFYHATLNDHGDTFVFDSGGYYEAVDTNGIPQKRVVSGSFIGYEKSDTPELAASASAEGAVFAVLKNFVNETGDAGGGIGVTPVRVYAVSRQPDIDIRQSVCGDFSLLEEVRYRNISENPINGELVTVVPIPARAFTDVELTYLPSRGGINDIITSWGSQVKKAIRVAIETGEYPDSVCEIDGVQMPDIEAYQPA